MNVSSPDERLVRAVFDPSFALDEDPGQPENSVLLARQRSGAAADWSAGAAHIAAGGLYRDKGEFASALAHFRAAFAHTSPELVAIVHIAAVQLQCGQYGVAERILDISRTCSPPSADIDLHLAHALWAQGKLVEALRLCAAMVVTFPHVESNADTAILMEGRGGDPSRALDWALAFLTANPSVALGESFVGNAAYAAIASGRATELNAALSQRAFDDTPPSGAIAAVSLAASVNGAWRNLVQSQPLSSDMQAVSLQPEAVRFLTLSEPLARVLKTADPETSALYGASLRSDDPFTAAGFELPRSEGVAARGFMTTDPSERQRLVDAARRLQLKILEDGVVELPSPFGGQTRSHASTLLNYDPARRELGSIIAYFFRSPQPSFVLFCSEDHWPLAWYDPLAHIILLHPGMDEFHQYLQERIRELRLAWLTDPGKTEAYLSFEGPRPTDLVVGMMDFISTNLFADIQGIQRVLDDGLLDRVDTLTVTGPEPFGPVQELFPELFRTLIHRPRAPDLVCINHRLWATQALAVRVTGGFVNDEVADRVVIRARHAVDAVWKRAVDELAEGRFPLIFVSLRAHSRRWLASGPTIAGVFNSLLETWPGLALIFDGHAVTDSPLPASLVQQEAQFLSDISTHLSADIPVLMSAGRSMSDTIYAAAYSHAHLSAQGTSTTKSVLIANKPGVVIGSRQFGWDAEAFRENCAPLVTPWESAVDAVIGDIQCDYVLPQDVVLQSLERILENVANRKCGAGQAAGKAGLAGPGCAPR